MGTRVPLPALITRLVTLRLSPSTSLALLSSSAAVDTVAADSAFDSVAWLNAPDGCTVAFSDDAFDCSYAPLTYRCSAFDHVADVAGTYEIELVVSDGLLFSAPDSVLVSTANSPPVADAGPDQSVFVTDLVQLDGSGSSDVDGDPLSYAWSFVSLWFCERLTNSNAFSQTGSSGSSDVARSPSMAMYALDRSGRSSPP